MSEPTNGTPLTDPTTHPTTDASTRPRTGAEPAATAPDAEPAATRVEPEHGRHRAAEELVHCPECGAAAMVTLNQRLAADFCGQCDFPLFWTPSHVVRETDDVSSESLQRLPGTVGRTTVASLPCPRCAEQNPVTGADCVRCGAALHPEPAPPPAPAPPVQTLAPVEEPEVPRIWLWVLVFVVSCLLLVAVAWYTSR